MQEQFIAQSHQIDKIYKFLNVRIIMEGKYILIFVAALILAFATGFFISRYVGFTGNVVENSVLNSYSYTKAICNQGNGCLDVSVVCENGKTMSIIPVSGVIQHDENWTDPRENNGFC